MQVDFRPLEPRQLLAVLSTPLTGAANHVVNGGFEDVDTTVTGNLYDTVNGWSAEGVGAQINIFTTLTDRENVLNLDSSADNFDVVFQDIDTTNGESYILAIDFRERPVDPDADPTTNTFEVYWDGELVGTFDGIEHWQTGVMSVTGSSTDLTRLELRELGTGDDGRGPLIDNVRLVLATEVGVENGDFEAFSVDVTGGFYAPNEIDGWSAMGVNLADRLLQIDTETGGNHVLNLDTTAAHVDRIYQDLTTVSGSQYFLQFELTAVGSDASANELRLRWNNAWAGTFQAGVETQSFGLLLDADSDLTRLVFREVAAGSDGNGPQIDNVRLFQVTNVAGDLAIDLDPNQTGNDENALFVEGAGPANVLADGLEISHLTGSGITSATISIDDRQDGTDEVLTVDVGDTGLIADFDASTGVLTITSPAGVRDFTLNDYEVVIGTLTYEDQAAIVTGGTRVISVTVTDTAIVTGNQTSDPVQINLVIDIDNVLPTITPIADQTTGFGEPFTVDVIATDPDDVDGLSYELKVSGSAVDGASNQPVISNTGQITWTPSQAGTATFTVTVIDDRGEGVEEEFDVTVTPFDPFAGNGVLANIPPAERNEIYGSSFTGNGPPMTISQANSYTAVISTDVGDIEINMFSDLTPLSVNNFVNLARDGYYDGLGFHRVVESARVDENGEPVLDGSGNIIFDRFVAQAGDPTNTSSGGPGYTINDEIRSELLFDGPGVLAWAKTGAPNSNGSQFFITYDATQFQNDENFTIFGEVIDFGEIIDGLNTLDRLNLTNPQDANPATPTTINSIVVTES